MVFSSASSVYGDTETMDEEHPLNARTMYGASKIAASTSPVLQREVRPRVHDPPLHERLRAAAGRRPHASVCAPAPGASHPHHGRRKPVLRLRPRRDVAEANVAAMASEVSGEELNVGSGTEASGNRRTLIGSSGRRRRGVPAGCPGPHEAARREQQKAKELLGWEASVRSTRSPRRSTGSVKRREGARHRCDRLRRFAPDTGAHPRRSRSRRGRARCRSNSVGRSGTRLDLAAPDWPNLPKVDAVVHLAQANEPVPEGATRCSPSMSRRHNAC